MPGPSVRQTQEMLILLAEVGRPLAGLGQLAPAEGLLASLAKLLALLIISDILKNQIH